MGCCRKTFTSPSTSASDDEQKKYNSSDPMLLPISLLAGLYQVELFQFCLESSRDFINTDNSCSGRLLRLECCRTEICINPRCDPFPVSRQPLHASSRRHVSGVPRTINRACHYHCWCCIAHRVLSTHAAVFHVPSRIEGRSQTHYKWPVFIRSPSLVHRSVRGPSG